MRLARIWVKAADAATFEALLMIFQATVAGRPQELHVRRFVLNAIQAIGVRKTVMLRDPIWILTTLQASWRHVIGEHPDEVLMSLGFSWGDAITGESVCYDQWTVFVDGEHVEVTLEGCSHGLCLRLEGELDRIELLLRGRANLARWSGKLVPLLDMGEDDDEGDDDADLAEGPLSFVIETLRTSPLP